MAKIRNKQTIILKSHPKIISTYSVVGPKEGSGPLKDYFNYILTDDLNGEKTYEMAESSLIYKSITNCIKNAGLKEQDIDFLLAGDLLNQTASSNFAARDIDIPFIGLYGACSTMAESLAVASILVDGNYGEYTVAATSSHFSSAERQFRFPLEYGSQRCKTSQWTVTGSGAMLIGKEGNYPYVSSITIGKVKDYGINDVNNMGAAMAPAAVDTIKAHLLDLNRNISDYDLIATGDLGKVGREITENLLKEYGYDVKGIYIDCGEEIYDNETQKTSSGGSGCGCSAVVASSYIYQNMINGKFKRVLLVSTGALLSTISTFQGETIPGIAHAVEIEFGG
ncbi:MAG: stage V sporulation protein AD [Clostridiaceae bacterium]